jgi:hypothetical protein
LTSAAPTVWSGKVTSTALWRLACGQRMSSIGVESCNGP